LVVSHTSTRGELPVDPLVERERRYNALAERYRSNLKMDVIYRALEL